MGQPFAGFDLSSFWEDSEYAAAEYTDLLLTNPTVAAVEKDLGYKLPEAYIALMRSRNGGIPRRRRQRTQTRTSWAKDHIAITGIFAIGRTRTCSLLGECGSRFWMSEWGYPELGVYFADCPSAGHDMLALDYRACGRNGEPTVVHVDQERDYAVTHVAESFEAFVRGLEDGAAFES